MTVRLTTDLRNVRLQPVLDALDAGSVEIRTGAKPTVVTDAATGTLLGTLVLDSPAGSISAGILTPAWDFTATAVADGTATWARWIDATGAVQFDTDVSLAGGSGEVQMTTVSISTGMLLPVSSAALT